MIDMLKRFKVVLLCIGVLTLVSYLIFLDFVGTSYTVREAFNEPLPDAVLAEKKKRAQTPKTCLLLHDTTQENSELFREAMGAVLYAEHVGYDEVDLGKSAFPDVEKYETCVIAFENLDVLGEDAAKLVRWVENGGRAMFFCTPSTSPVFQYLAPYFGITDGAANYAMISNISLEPGFMIGGEPIVLHWGEPMPTALNAVLAPEAEVFAVSRDKSMVPLLWREKYGKGCFVVHNHGMYDKGGRGFFASSYNLLEDVCVYPVINASAWFLDDFPSPVPMGDSTYIRKDYGRDISSFYSIVWWPDMLSLCDTYGIRYTGLVIEDYNDTVEGVFTRQSDQVRFNHFGAMLLDYGGEIGIHGYNHQPICFPGFQYEQNMDYVPWPDEASVVRAMDEVKSFIAELFPEVNPAVYIPPSNVLSEEGRAMFPKDFPYLKAICSLFLEGECSYEQEFEVADDGVIEFPRVISGAVLDEYMRWVAAGCLNLYYVNSHFIHPDDVLDEDRGAELGWQKLFQNLTDYMDWLYTSAPNIRNTTGTEGANATARYDALSMDKHYNANGDLVIRLEGFWDEAYLMMRCNKGTPGEITGGEIEPISGDFYLIHALSDMISVKMN